MSVKKIEDYVSKIPEKKMQFLNVKVDYYLYADVKKLLSKKELTWQKLIDGSLKAFLEQSKPTKKQA